MRALTLVHHDAINLVNNAEIMAILKWSIPGRGDFGCFELIFFIYFTSVSTKKTHKKYKKTYVVTLFK